MDVQLILEHHELVCIVGLHVDLPYQLAQLHLLLLLPLQRVSHHQDLLPWHPRQKFIVVEDRPPIFNDAQPHELVFF